MKSAVKSAKKLIYQGKKSLEEALQKLKMDFPNFDLSSRLLSLISKEKKVEIFGKLPKKCKVTYRDSIAEPFDAGSIQGPTLYGVGTGKRPVSNNNYSTYLDDNNIPMCWGFKVPLSFGLGGKDKRDNPVGKSGGGTNHEMEHAIKCVTQCMLNGLAQRTTNLKNDKETKAHNLMRAILKEIEIVGDDKKLSLFICQLLRKQQVIAGLPSCSLFNQIKCDIDMIKLSLLELPNNKEWFYVEVSPDKDEITRLVKNGYLKKVGQDKIKLTFCNFYGILADDKSAWKDLETLKRTYEKGGVREIAGD